MSRIVAIPYLNKYTNKSFFIAHLRDIAVKWENHSHAIFNQGVLYSCKQQHKVVSRGVLKAYNFFVQVKAENKIDKSTEYQYLNRPRVLKVLCFPFPYFCFLLQISMNVLSLILRDSTCFLSFPLNFCAGNWGRPEFISSRMFYVWPLCWSNNTPSCLLLRKPR